ncbi:MAG: DUF983 domain-containing protein [Acidimicrobiia bacterium]
MAYEFPTSRAVFIWRGITKACPRCGSHKTHDKYFKPKTNCPVCGLKFEKEHGYWTGSLAFNTIITGGLVAISLLIGLVSTAPDIPVVPLLLTIIPIAILVPIIIYPFTHTIWMAIDYGFLSRLDRDN